MSNFEERCQLGFTPPREGADHYFEIEDAYYQDHNQVISNE